MMTEGEELLQLPTDCIDAFSQILKLGRVKMGKNQQARKKKKM